MSAPSTTSPTLRRRGLALAVAAALLLPLPVRAQLAVYDPANHWENIQQVLHAVYAIYQRIEQIERLIEQVEWMERQLEGLEDPHSREVATLLYTLSRVIQRGEALVYSLEDLAARYEELYRGFEASDQPVADHQEQTRVLLDTAEAVLLGAKRLANNSVPAQQALGAMKAQLHDAETNAELLQAAGLITAWSGEETSKLLEQTLALTNLLAVDVAHRANSEAMAEATLERWIAAGYRPERYDATGAPPLVPRGYPGAPR